MSKRYKLEQLSLLQKTNNQSFYRSLRQNSANGCQVSAKRSQSNSQTSSWRRQRIKSTDTQSQKRQSSDLTVRYLKDKLTQIMSQSNSKGMNICRNSSSSPQNTMNKSESFRITPYRKTFRRNNLFRAPETKEEFNIEDIQNEFKVKQACIQQRKSANDPKEYDKIGFPRHFLKFHGQNKCFQKAVLFNKNKAPHKNDKVIALLQKERFQIEHDSSLEYSQDLQANIGLQGWKKSTDKMEWSGFSNFDN